MKKVSRNRLPSSSGVYLFKDSGNTIIYIGKAANLRKRVSSYFSKRAENGRSGMLREKIKDIDYIATNSETEALVLESSLIKERQPCYNVRLRDDKKYPYLVITKEEFPRISITRSPEKDRGWVYGPYTDVKSLRRAVKMLSGIFHMRRCNYDLSKKKIKRPCLYYDLKQCSGVCAGYITGEEYNKTAKQARLFLEGKNRILRLKLEREMKKASLAQEYEKAAEIRDRLKAIEKVLEVQVVFSPRGGEGDFWAIAQKKEIASINLFKVREGRVTGRELFTLRGSPVFSTPQTLEEFLCQYYSGQDLIPSRIYTNIAVPGAVLLKKYLARKRGKGVPISSPIKGKKRGLLKLGEKNARLRLEEESIKDYPETKGTYAMKELAEILKLPGLPHRIEGIDISHIHGEEATGVITVFENGKPLPAEYRRFRIKFSPTRDDCAMISEIVERRYRRLLEREIIRPGLILVDGGKGQAGSALSKLKELGMPDIPVAGIAKRFEHIYIPGNKGPVAIPEKGDVLNLLKNIRDEAHRFARKYHHILRSKKVFL